MLSPREPWAQAPCLGSQAVWTWRMGLTVSPLGSPQGAERAGPGFWVELAALWLGMGWKGRNGFLSEDLDVPSSPVLFCMAGGTRAWVFVSAGL